MSLRQNLVMGGRWKRAAWSWAALDCGTRGGGGEAVEGAWGTTPGGQVPIAFLPVSSATLTLRVIERDRSPAGREIDVQKRQIEQKQESEQELGKSVV